MDPLAWKLFVTSLSLSLVGLVLVVVDRRGCPACRARRWPKPREIDSGALRELLPTDFDDDPHTAPTERMAPLTED